MSLILEALKKSEAKRRLGEAPDLDTPFAAQHRRRSPLPLIVVAILVTGGVGWWLLRSPAAPTPTVSTPTPAQVKPPLASTPAAPVKPLAANPPPIPAPPAAAPPPGTKTMAEMSQISQWVPVGQGSMRAVGADRKRATTAANPASALPTRSAPAKPLVTVATTNAANPSAVVTPPPGVKKPEPAVEPVSVAGLKKSEPPTMTASGIGVKKTEPPLVTASGPGVKKPEPTAEAGANPGVKKPEPAPVAGSDSGALPYYQLPFSVRKDLPALKLSMHVYAPEPSQRFIILNDSRMIEGNSQEDLSLREIRPDGAVFEFRGQRFFYPRDGL